MLYKFGPFCLDVKRRELRRNGEPVALTPRAFDILLLLVENAGQVVPREQVMNKIWGLRAVEEGNLTQNIFLLRRILGTDENGNSLIQTIPRVGYRFIAAVTVEDPNISENGNGALPQGTAASYWSQHSPFRGLRAFEPKDWWLFFGRDSETSELCERLNRASVVAVLGNSGSGKSSLVRAGLIPALRRMRYRPVEPAVPWRVALFRPSNSPFDYLAEILPDALAPEMSREEQAEFTADFRVTLPRGGNALHDAISELRDAVTEDAQRSHFLLVADQFEEIFTLTADPEVRERYIEGLLSAARADGPFPVHLVFVLRADFFSECLEIEELSDCLERNLYNVPRMTSEHLREIIEKRLALASARAEAGLTESLLADVGAEPGNLALLEHALGQLWKKCGGYSGLLTNDAYTEIGRVRGALSQHADEVYQSLGDESERQLAQKIFLQLVHLGDGGQDTSRRVRKSDLFSLGPADLVETLLTQLSSSRLISIGGEAEDVFIEVSHEALIRNWSTLRQWLTQNREELELERRLRQAAEEWARLDSDPGALLQGARLAQGAEWWARHKQAPVCLQRFLQASVDARAAAEQRTIEAQKRELAHQLELRRQAEARATAEKQLREQQEAGALQMSKAAARLRRYSWALALLAILLMLASAGLWFAYRRSLIEQARALEARALGQVEESKALAAQSMELLKRDRFQAQALAIRSWDVSKTEEAHFAIAAAFPEQIASLEHKGPVVRAVFSPDGRQVLTASDDKTSRLWNSADGRLLFNLAGHTDRVEHATFSSDGKRIATASRDHTARIWSSSDGRLLVTLKGHTGWVLWVTFSPDGQRVLTASSDHTARLWSSTNGRLLNVLSHDREVARAEFSPDGRRIVTASWDKTAKIWNTADGKLLTTLRGHTREVMCAAFSPDGQQIVTTGIDNVAQLWNSGDGRSLAKFEHDAAILMAAFSPDGHQIVTASEDGTARIWNVNGSLVTTLHHGGGVPFAQFSSDGKYVFTASVDHKARVWSANGTLLAVFQAHAEKVTHVAVSPDNQYVVTASTDHTARLWSMSGGRLLAQLAGHKDQVFQVAFSPEGQRIATASMDQTARIWNANDGQLLTTLRGHTDEVLHVAFSPDGQQVVTCGYDRTARLWNSSTGKQTAILQGHTDTVHAVEFSYDGQRIVTASFDKTARIWSATDGRLIAILNGHTNTVWRARFSPDGRSIVTASEDGTARIWDSSDGSLRATLKGHAQAVNDAEFSPDHQRIVTASSDATVRLWSPDGTPLLVLRGHTEKTWFAKFSPDGKQIVTVSNDKTARIWNSVDGRQVAVLNGHTKGVTYGEFSPDGKRVVTSSYDSTALLWNSADGALIATLKGHIDTVFQATFSPDGRRIATAGLDHTGRIWTMMTLSDVEAVLAK